MGTSTNAILFYGYCWDWETHRLWPRGDDECGHEWKGRLAEKYMVDLDSDAGQALIGIQSCAVGEHCSDRVPIPYVYVACTETIAWRGCPARIETDVPLTANQNWDAQLDAFCAELEISTEGMRAGWWLVSMWS